ncbi:glycosyltransferase family 2 protein [Echinicola rosea]|uniref:Glycosyltransferase 2-like domain-containing protein n=1 Tax=Echinicola rosea TaxID=1807691 RepID=A0ABQ1VDH7_9BACT|nr:glycosyltransferase family 2 protein [Echinicola rosea]GGF51465.1 hypothetical protein GCM10011339_45000 [Echinicola rosea]
MLVSVISPVFNKGKYIKSTIESVISQSYDDWELLLIDDGSTDNSLNIASEIAKKDSRIKVYERKDYSDTKGANVCRNVGMNVSQGKFIIFLDSDDLLLPHCIEQRIKCIKDYPGYSSYIFNVAYCKGPKATPYAKEGPPPLEVKQYIGAKNKEDYFLRKFLKFDLPWHTSGPIWDKDFLLSISGFNEKIQRLQDPEIHIRALLSDRISVKYLMHKTEYDVLHRNDDDRVVWNKEEFLRKQLEAIYSFLLQTIPLISKKRGIVYLEYMQGYLWLAEKLIYRHIRNFNKYDDKSVLLSKMDEIYSDAQIEVLLNGGFKLKLNIYRFFFQSFFIKRKIPGFILYMIIKYNK